MSNSQVINSYHWLGAAFAADSVIHRFCASQNNFQPPGAPPILPTRNGNGGGQWIVDAVNFQKI